MVEIIYDFAGNSCDEEYHFPVTFNYFRLCPKSPLSSKGSPPEQSHSKLSMYPEPEYYGRNVFEKYDSLLIEVKRALEHRRSPPSNPPPYPRPPRPSHSPNTHQPLPHSPPLPPPKASQQNPSSAVPAPPKKPLPHANKNRTNRLSQLSNSELQLINKMASLETTSSTERALPPKPSNRNSYRRSAAIEDTVLLSNHRPLTRKISPAITQRRFNDDLEDIPEHMSHPRAPIVRRISTVENGLEGSIFSRQELDDFPTPKPRNPRRTNESPLAHSMLQSHSHHLLPTSTSTFSTRHLAHPPPPPPPPQMKPKPPVPRNKPVLKLTQNH